VVGQLARAVEEAMRAQAHRRLHKDDRAGLLLDGEARPRGPDRAFDLSLVGRRHPFVVLQVRSAAEPDRRQPDFGSGVPSWTAGRCGAVGR
jgi:hypothetical protein